MAKARPGPGTPKTAPSGGSTLILVVGGAIVIGLVAFSFSRTMQKPASLAQADAAPQTAALPPAIESRASIPQDNTAPVSLPPAVSPRGDVPMLASPAIPGPADVAPTKAQLAAVPRIEPQDLFQKIERRQVTLIDVRDVDSYRARHIPGAMQIPLSFIAGEVPYLPKDKPIVTYCTWPAEESSAGAALKLEQAGIRNVSALRGGLEEWERNGYPVEAGLSK